MRKTLVVLSALAAASPAAAQITDFCTGMPRAENAGLEPVEFSTDWFDVYELVPGIFSIHEPHQWQEIISYLIVGDQQAVLFDTGNGIANMKTLVDRITDKPVIVVNSHSHSDHVGDNHRFETVLALETDYGIRNSEGFGNEEVREELSAEAVCKALPKGVTQDSFVVPPWKISRFVEDGDEIDIGGRVLEIVHTPGHSPDSLMLLDRASGFLWTGDTYHPRDIWLYSPGTDLAAWKATITMLADLSPGLTRLFPAHNVLVDEPESLVKARDAFADIMSGKADKEYDDELGTVRYLFETFSILMRDDHPIIE